MSPIAPTAPLSPLAKTARPLRWLVWCAPLILAACSGPSVPQEPVATRPAQESVAQPTTEQDSVYDGTDRSWTDVEAGTRLTQESLATGNNMLSNSPWTAASNGWGPTERNVSNGGYGAKDGRTMSVNGKKYDSGFGAHSKSSMTFNVGGMCNRFISDVGIDDEVGDKGSVVFQVYADGVKLFDSGRMTGKDAAKTVNVDIAGRKALKLMVTDAGDNNHYDHANWGGAILVDCNVAKPVAPATAPTPIPTPPAPVPAPAPAPVPAPVPVPAPIVVNGPLVITKGGTYSGEYLSNDPSVPVIQIKTSEPVILENCTLRGRGHLINAAWSWANLTVRNCKGYGLNPNDAGRIPGRFLNAEGITSLLIENNFMEKTAGIYVNTWKGNTGLPMTVVIRNNLARNIEGRFSDGNGGFQDKFYRVQFVQLNNMRDLSGAEIAWNRVENTARQSHVEDVINIHDSNGTPSSPIRIHNNLINGAFSGRPDATYSGGGIMMGDGCNSGYTEATGNTVLETSNYGIAVAGGHHQKISGNTLLALGKLSDGTLLDADSDSGFYLRNYCQTPTDVSTVIAEGNTVGWGTPSASNPDARWDWSVTAGVERNNTSIQAANRAVNPLLLAQAITAWEGRAKAAGMVIGTR
ncbi:NPCBM/NEW2 domain-containing protein [Deinococcus marmoris]|uniref:NPCBM/NEW2 domain-containing protein n=1 Tax=Deinococcus marmoris TaxID=249408 RepID=UPI00068B7B38|nr:NPCBM/NEW2 domain-containing protein [Deinococcus marmoris]